MPWFFPQPDTVTSELIQTTEEESIVETEYDGCAWCGTGEGICADHQAQMFAQSAERAEKRGRA